MEAIQKGGTAELERKLRLKGLNTVLIYYPEDMLQDRTLDQINEVDKKLIVEELVEVFNPMGYNGEAKCMILAQEIGVEEEKDSKGKTCWLSNVSFDKWLTNH